VVVTGAAGFIGSHVVERLLAGGRAVVGIDNFDPFYDRGAKERNLAEATGGGGNFELVEADICDHERMDTVFGRVRPQGVIHLAAKAGVRPSIEDPTGYTRANVLGTAVVLGAAQGAGCGRIVMASSSSVYGNSTVVPFSEAQDVSKPISPYAATKAACELMAHTHWHLYKMPTACLRFFTVFGPRQRPDLAISSFLRKVSRDETITVFGDGTSSRDYTYIDDIVSGVLAAYDRIDHFGYRVWNLGGNQPTTLSKMVEVIGRVVGKPARTERVEMQPGDVERTWADLTRSTGELGYQAKTPFEKGVSRQWGWMRG